MEQRGLRHTKPFANYGKDSIEAVRRRDQIKSLAMRIGRLTSKQYRALDPEERADLNDVARKMHELGSDYAVAQRAERVVTEGFVYVITHPAFPEYVKIGRAFDPESRLSGYQTGCPRRDYKLHFAAYFVNCHSAERFIHDWLADYRAEGEWFRLLPCVAEQVIYELMETGYVG